MTFDPQAERIAKALEDIGEKMEWIIIILCFLTLGTCGK